jgi:hypothetical protein
VRLGIVALFLVLVAVPFRAEPQQPPPFAPQPVAISTIGYLSPRSRGVETELLAALRKGLHETGHFEGKTW